MHVKPAPGLSVRNPHTHALIPEAGIEVGDHDFLFHQLIGMGDVVIAKFPEQEAVEAEAAKQEAGAQSNAEREVAAGAALVPAAASTEGAH